jgi:hypothetical protein
MDEWFVCFHAGDVGPPLELAKFPKSSARLFPVLLLPLLLLSPIEKSAIVRILWFSFGITFSFYSKLQKFRC